MTIPESPYGPSTVATPAVSVPVARRARGLGIASLVLALIPQVVVLIIILIASFDIARDDTGWAILGWAILGAYAYAILGLILGGTALGIGIAAAVKNRGRGPGIAGAVIGGVTLLLLLGLFAPLFLQAFSS